MSAIRIVVNKMPEVDTECPFAVQSGDNVIKFPCVCNLKRNKSSDYWDNITFGTHKHYNCRLSENKSCDMLEVL